MTTIYKMKKESSPAKNILYIMLSENTKKLIHDWQIKMDEIVFDEQIKTGSFHGCCPVNDTKRSKMKLLQEKGIIKPYYGATSVNACTYAIQIIPPKCIVCVENEVVQDKVSFEDTVEIKLLDASEIEAKKGNEFLITGKEYLTLNNWKYWDPKDELTSRYIYKFSPGSIGVAIAVIDTFSKEKIDISDYSGW